MDERILRKAAEKLGKKAHFLGVRTSPRVGHGMEWDDPALPVYLAWEIMGEAGWEFAWWAADKRYHIQGKYDGGPLGPVAETFNDIPEAVINAYLGALPKDEPNLPELPDVSPGSTYDVSMATLTNAVLNLTAHVKHIEAELAKRKDKP